MAATICLLFLSGSSLASLSVFLLIRRRSAASIRSKIAAHLVAAIFEMTSFNEHRR
jgi:hypothetical protein